MEEATGTACKILRDYNPVIYLSSGDPGFFSLQASKPSPGKDERAFECMGCNSASSVYYEVYSFPEPKFTPEYALYSFATNVLDIFEIKAITYQLESNIIRVWTFIAKRDKTVRRRIYLKELALMDSYPDMIFDFNRKKNDYRTDIKKIVHNTGCESPPEFYPPGNVSH